MDLNQEENIVSETETGWQSLYHFSKILVVDACGKGCWSLDLRETETRDLLNGDGKTSYRITVDGNE